MKQAGVYKIQMNEAGKCYVGSSVNIERRWKRHKYELEAGIHHSAHLQRAWSKYGADKFSFLMLEEVPIGGMAGREVKTLMMSKEQYWMDVLQPCFNTLPNAFTTLGFRHSAETKQRIADFSRAQDHSTRGAKISAAKTGQRHTDATKEKLRIAITGKRHSPETREKIRLAGIGRKPSEATLGKLKGRKLTAEHRETLRIANTGKKMSLESREKMRDANLGKQLSEEHKAAIRAGMLAHRSAQREKSFTKEPK